MTATLKIALLSKSSTRLADPGRYDCTPSPDAVSSLLAASVDAIFIPPSTLYRACVEQLVSTLVPERGLDMAEKHALDQFSQSAEGSNAQVQWYSTNDPKRRKVDQQMAKASVDPHNAPASRVVHARAVPDGCTFQMLVSSLARFGKIR